MVGEKIRTDWEILEEPSGINIFLPYFNTNTHVVLIEDRSTSVLNELDGSIFLNVGSYLSVDCEHYRKFVAVLRVMDVACSVR